MNMLYRQSRTRKSRPFLSKQSRDERDPELCYRRGYQQGALAAIQSAIAHAGDRNSLFAPVFDWCDQDIHRWRKSVRRVRTKPPEPPLPKPIEVRKPERNRMK
jgi:hypothetical protein